MSDNTRKIEDSGAHSPAGWPSHADRIKAVNFAAEQLEMDMHAPGAKADAGKPRWSLLPLDAIGEIAKVLTFGAKKYSDGGWMHVPNAKDRYLSAMLRHLEKRQRGERVDSESGVLTMAHVACNALFVLWFEMRDGE